MTENLRRRHLEISQRAAIPFKSGILCRFEEEAKARMSQGGEGRETIPYLRRARDEAAAMFLVNPYYVSDAKRIGHQWWIGDWANYGERRWGELKPTAELAGFDYGTVRTYGWVANRCHFSRLSLYLTHLDYRRHTRVSLRTHSGCKADRDARAR